MAMRSNVEGNPRLGRLAAVRGELLAGKPGTTVTDIATRWVEIARLSKRAIWRGNPGDFARTSESLQAQGTRSRFRRRYEHEEAQAWLCRGCGVSSCSDGTGGRYR